MKTGLTRLVGLVTGYALWSAFPLYAAEVIVDNTNAGFSVLTGSWSTGTGSSSTHYGTNYRYATTASSATAQAQWQPTIPEDGDYQVFVWYPSATNRVSDVRYQVYYNGGSQNFTVNQTINPGSWVLLGTFNFAAGSSGNGRVTITNQSATTGRRAYADAVRFFKPEPTGPQFRAHWADAFHVGFKSKADIDTLITRTLTGGYNAIVAEVCAYHDNASSAHGAYWNSSIVPKAPDINATGLPNGDPLAYLVQQAHANNIEVHCWMVAFRMSSTWPPAGNSYLAAHPEMFAVLSGSMGGGPAAVGGAYVLDPGSPDAQDYLMSIVRELATNYEIDGVNWDYIRYTQTDGGYPADTNYANSGLKRFQRITGRSDTPAPTGDTEWNDFRRRTIDEVVRRTRMEMASITSNPRQPLRFSCDVVCFGDAPTNFSSSSAYAYYSNWEKWMRLGWLDTAMPMCYDREYNSSQALWYRNWVKAALNWRYDRHVVIGQANYLNTMADSVTQMEFAYETDDSRSAEGTVNYSYYSTVDSNMDGSTENDWAWYNHVGANLFTTTADIPSMPWRNPATATEGSLWGQVTRDGQPVDNATVQVGALPAVQTDGAGYYVVTLIPATSGGSTAYNVTASEGADSSTHNAVLVYAGDQRREDIELDSAVPLVITQQPQPTSVCPGSTATFTVAATGEGPIQYRWQKNGVNLVGGTSHYSGITQATLSIFDTAAGDVADYRCVVTDTTTTETINSDAASLTLKAQTIITAQPPASQTICENHPTQLSVTATGEGQLSYQWKLNDQNITGATNSTYSAAEAGTYVCVVTGGCGQVTSNAASVTVTPDSDDDGTCDDVDGCPNDPLKTAPGACGCGVAETDSDTDGTPDCNDGCPNDANKIAPGVCGCGVAETDSDSDGTPDCNDGCPVDGNKIAAGVCGCGTPDADADLDGVIDCVDNCPSAANADQADSDSDGVGDACELPVLINAASRAQHGASLSFDIAVTPAYTVEPRSLSQMQLVVKFSEPIDGLGGLDNSDVSASSGSVASLTRTGDTLYVGLTGVPSGVNLTVSFPGIADLTGNAVTGTVCLGVLIGDINADRSVNIFDVVLSRNELSKTPDATNFRSDVNTDGTINIFDLVVTRNSLGAAIAAACP